MHRPRKKYGSSKLPRRTTEAASKLARRTAASSMASATRACLFALVVGVALAFLFFFDGAAAARTAGTSAAEQRRRQVQSLLRRLNKPPLSTIESPDGDIIDCVHISKQPAFDHPLLKNHTIQMRPSCHPEGLDNKSNIAPIPFTQTWHQNGKCPENTIPIQRTKEEDVLRVSSIERYGKKWPWSIPNRFSIDDPDAVNILRGHQYAIASTSEDGNYYGTKATFNLWEPVVETNEGIFSLTQFWISSGSYSNNDLNTIEVGWQVYPGMYKDSHPRLFIYWTRDAYKETGCYNLCHGFVQTSNQIAIGASSSYLSPVSIYGGSQYEVTILVWKDTKGGNWWLQVGGHDVGYWPASIFSKLAGSATTVEWGGEVASSPDSGQTFTQMGSGHFPEEGFSKASYVRNIQLVDSTNTLKSPSSVTPIAMWSNCYNVQNGTSADWGTYIYYGGPGKNSNCQ